MAICESHESYTELLSGRISTELDNSFRGRHSLGTVWVVIESTALYQHMENISLEEALAICEKVFNLFPQYKEDLEARMEEKTPWLKIGEI